MDDMAEEVILGHIEVQTDWYDLLRKSCNKIWVSYSEYGKKSIYGDIKAILADGDPQLECTDGFEAHYMGKRVLVVKHKDHDITSYFFSPIGVFDNIHDKTIRCVDVSPGGGLAVSCGNDQGLFVWQTDDGVIRRTLDGHVSDVTTCRFFPSGVVILSGGVDMRLRIWSVEDGSCPATLTGHTGAITSTEIIERGRNVISCSRDGSVRLWDCGTAQEIAKITNSSSVINNSSLMKYNSIQTDDVMHRNDRESGTSDKLLTIAREDGCFEGVDLFTRKQVFHHAFNCAVNDCCFINENTVCAGLQDGRLVYFDIRNTGRPTRSVKHGKSPITCVKEFPGHSVLIGKNDGTTSCVRQHNDNITLELNGPECDTLCSISCHNNFVYTACRDRKIRKYRLDLNT